MENQKCKGMRDLLPNDMICFRRIEDAFRTCCLRHGYHEVRTPTLEYLHLFTAIGTLTPSMLSKVYSFLDWNGWSGERVVMRPDGTIPIARLYTDNLSEYKTARLYYVTNIFAFEETGKVNREHWQCGAEFLGGTGLAADAEIISLAKEVIQQLGINDVRLQLSHAGLIKALIRELELNPGEEAKVTSCVLDGDWQTLMKTKVYKSQLDKFLSPLISLKGKSSGFLQNAKSLYRQASPDFKYSIETFIDTTTLLDSLSCDYEIDITSIKGFEYYTGVCFQLLVGGEKIGGGGRYDDLIPLMSGKNIPACGFALYIDPLMRFLPLENKVSEKSRILVSGKKITPKIVRNCFSVAQKLREAMYIVEIDFSKEEPSAYRWVISVSENETCPFTVLDCEQKQQREVTSLLEILSILGG